jgi:phage tail protein X
MAVIGFELYQVTTDFVSCDMLIWKRYKRKAPDMVELMLDANPQLAFVHRTTPFIPPGTYVRVPIDPGLILGRIDPLPTDSLWTDQGYTK